MKIKHSKPFIDNEDIYAVKLQVKSGLHASGEKAREFEKSFSKLIGKKYAIATSSGSSALHLALLSLGIKKDDEVILPSFVCQAVMNSINYVKATSIFVDIQDDYLDKGFNLSIETIKPFITNKTKVIIIPHLFGIPVNIEPIIKYGLEHDIFIIEDCAQSLGVKYKDNNYTGNKGLISIFSFYATKIISTGQGGMILTSSEKIKNKIKELMKYDKKEIYNISYNYDMTDIQAALGISQLKKLNFFINKRREIRRKFDEAFRKLPIKLTNYGEGFPYRYIVKLLNKEYRDDVMGKLKSQDIDVELPIFKPLYQFFELEKFNFKNTDNAYGTCLSIPIYPALTEEEVDYIIDSVKECFLINN